MTQIIWKKNEGRASARTSIHIEEEFVYFTTRGESNKASFETSSFCSVEKSTGKYVYKIYSYSPIRSMSIFPEFAAVSSDDACLKLISKKSGKIINAATVESPIVGTVSYVRGYYIFATESGIIYRFTISNPKPEIVHIVDCKVFAGISLFKDSNEEDRALLFCANGLIYNFGITSMPGDSDLYFNDPMSLNLFYDDKYAKQRKSPARFFAEPLIVETYAYISYLRTTSYRSPPLACIDLESMKIVWHSTNDHRQDGAVVECGNVRHTPIKYLSNIILAPSYDNGIIYVDFDTGKVIERIAIGTENFQQWASPGQHNDRFIYFVNIRGEVVNFDLQAKRVVWKTNIYNRFVFRFKFLNGFVSPICNPVYEAASDLIYTGFTTRPAYSSGYLCLHTVDGIIFMIKDTVINVPIYDVISENEKKFSSAVDKAKPFFDSIRNITSMSAVALAFYYLKNKYGQFGYTNTQVFALVVCALIYLRCTVHMFRICKPGTELIISKFLFHLGLQPKENAHADSYFYTSISGIETLIFALTQILIFSVIFDYLH